MNVFYCVLCCHFRPVATPLITGGHFPQILDLFHGFKIGVLSDCLVETFIMPPPRRGGEAGALIGDRRPSSVRLSDVAYIGSNSKTIMTDDATLWSKLKSTR